MLMSISMISNIRRPQMLSEAFFFKINNPNTWARYQLTVQQMHVLHVLSAEISTLLFCLVKEMAKVTGPKPAIPEGL